jgi:PAS domain S-box-containing protein
MTQNIEEMRQENQALRQENHALREEIEQMRVQMGNLHSKCMQSQKVFEKLPSLIYIYDAQEHRNVLANREMAAMLGYSPEDIQAMGNSVLATIIHPDDMQTVIAEHFERVAQAKDDEVHSVEYRLQTKGGEWRWVLARDVVFARTDDGHVWQTLGTVHDITDRRERELELQEREERFSFVLEGSSDGAWDAHLTTGKAYFSQRYAEIIGENLEDLTTMEEGWTGRLHPDDVERAYQYFQDYLTGKVDNYEAEHRLRHKSGGWVWILSRGKTVAWDENGTPIRMSGTIRDITHQKQMEEELQRNQRLFQHVLDHLPSVVTIRDLDHRYIMVNKTGANVAGIDRDEFIGKRDSDLFSPEVGEKWKARNDQVFQTGEVVEETEEFPLNGEMAIFLSIAFPVTNEAGEIYALGSVSTDITEQTKAEAERIEMQEQIIQAQRDALRELSAPLLPISDTVVVLPLVGTIDSRRAQQVMETLLEGVADHNAELAIVDITGVQVVDTQVANALIQAAQAVKLLGAQVVLTGIGPTMAQTLVHLGADLSSIVTRGTLQSGINYALSGALSGE